jgi:hypothetical protein
MAPSSTVGGPAVGGALGGTWTAAPSALGGFGSASGSPFVRAPVAEAAPVPAPGPRPAEYPAFAMPSVNATAATAASSSSRDDEDNNEEAQKVRDLMEKRARDFSTFILQLPPRVVAPVALNRFKCTFQNLDKRLAKALGNKENSLDVGKNAAAAAATSAASADVGQALRPLQPAPSAPAAQPTIPAPAQPMFGGGNAFGGAAPHPTSVATSVSAPSVFAGFSFTSAPSPASASVPFSFSTTPAPEVAEAIAAEAAAAAAKPAEEDAENFKNEDDGNDDGPSWLPGGVSADAKDWDVRCTVEAKAYKHNADGKPVAFCTSDLKLERRFDNPQVSRLIMRDRNTHSLVMNIAISKGMPIVKAAPIPNAKKPTVTIRFKGLNAVSRGPTDGTTPETFALSIAPPQHGDKLHSELKAITSP